MKFSYILRRNIIYFFISFFSAGSTNIIPQLFYDRNQPAQKGLYLSITLIITSLAAVLGVYIAGRFPGRANKAVIPVFLLFAAGFCVTVFTDNQGFFILLLAITAFFCNFLYNYCDGLFLSHTSPLILEQHIKTILIYQLIGYMLSPIFFAVFGQNKAITLVCIILLALLSLYPIIQLFRPGIKAELDVKPETHELVRGVLNSRELLFVLYSLCVMMAEMIALSFMTYFLSDYYRLADYEVKSGIAMIEIILLSGLTVVLTDMKGKHINDKVKVDTDSINTNNRNYEYSLFSPLLNLSSVILFMVSIILLALQLDNSFWYILLSLAPVGPAYGCFLKKSRSYASNMSVKNKKSVLISTYNNMQCISGLAGYFIVMLCWLTAEWLHFQYLKLAIGAIIFMLVLAAAFIVLWAASYKQDTKVSLENYSELHI